MRENKTIIYILIILLCVLLCACAPRSVEVSGISVDLDATELYLQRKNITDISSLYSLENLESVDLRNNEISQEDILEFIQTNPDCQVLWSVPVCNQTFDSTADTISFADCDVVDTSDAAKVLGCFENLKKVELLSSNISLADYHKLKNDYPEIDFDMTVIVWDIEFECKSTTIDLSDCKDINEDTLIEELKYFNEISSLSFGDISISDELKDKLIEKYPNANFEWKAQFLDAEYSSIIDNINISENEILNFESFKNQLKYFTNLTYIDMCDCGLTNLQMEELIAEYPQIKFVWIVQVGSWEMRTDIIAFGTCYSEDFEGGRYIGGSGSWLEDEEAANLKYCKDLVTLDIGHQHAINDYSFLLELDNLKHLIVALSKFEDTSLLTHMNDLEFLEIFNTPVSDLSPLAELPNLKYLNCSQTLIPNVDYLVDMKQLEVLWLCNAEHISRAEAARLEEALPDCYINTTAQGSTRSGWRSYDNQGYVDMREALDMYLAFETE